jgi:catechol 2,3-dioxygenase-like lactoylglutathione lyase family enzyme
MQGFTSLGHVAIRVRDVERTLDFYTGKLGFQEMLRLDREDGRLWLLYLRITDDQFLEVFPEAVGERALVTCLESNVASARIIEANGGVLEDARDDPAGRGKLRRYWIAL